MLCVGSDHTSKSQPRRGAGVAGPVGVVLDDRLTIACADAAIRPTLLQRAGKPAMTAADALRGWSVPVGTRVG